MSCIPGAQSCCTICDNIQYRLIEIVYTYSPTALDHFCWRGVKPWPAESRTVWLRSEPDQEERNTLHRTVRDSWWLCAIQVRRPGIRAFCNCRYWWWQRETMISYAARITYAGMRPIICTLSILYSRRWSTGVSPPLAGFKTFRVCVLPLSAVLTSLLGLRCMSGRSVRGACSRRNKWSWKHVNEWIRM